ncbi:hypothetical protein NDU88_006690 [Pleurodeles waltl]|uniref:Uncharacterized protein n=1 Tax=Pleurodeles waltl TaxID=8319 RepID=A0AAV7ULR1_PLEWA|nr:hypothetical protein NDU88_006690 [Pleurodeles waltl]
MWSQEAAPAPMNHEDKLDKILEAIETAGQDLRNRVDAVAIEVTLLHEDQKKLQGAALGWEFWVLFQAIIKFKEDARQAQAQT